MKFRIIIKEILETDELKTVYVGDDGVNYDDKYDAPGHTRASLAQKKIATGGKVFQETELFNQVVQVKDDAESKNKDHFITSVIKSANGI